MSERDVVITGIGLVSCLGEGTEAHWRAMTRPAIPPRVETERFAPYSVHPLPEIDWNKQIPRRGDQRQMETWQRIGTYTAGLALDDAGLPLEDPLRSSMDMVVAAGGGERDEAVDVSILDASVARNDPAVLVNEKLMTDLRPTLFLAQLSNLLAGNISIVHKVTGSSRTFMGEEGAGISAVQTAAARIRSGQSTHVLVGAAYNSEHRDMLLPYALGGYLHRGEWQPVWRRTGAPEGGLIPGSGGAFLVMEARAHAQARNCTPYATVSAVASDRVRREDRFPDNIQRLFQDIQDSATLVISAASGAVAATRAEEEALAQLGLAVRAFASQTGHMKEAAFPFAIALAALALANGEAPSALDDERAWPGEITEALATSIGFHSGAGVARLTKVV
jgi:3-oxoacyl-[acyl-carrier-protein] synthase II